jgi:hypothetical protein
VHFGRSSLHAPDEMINVSILTTSHVPNLTFFVPNLGGALNVPKIEQCRHYSFVNSSLLVPFHEVQQLADSCREDPTLCA